MAAAAWSSKPSFSQPKAAPPGRPVALDSLDRWELFCQKGELVQRDGGSAMILDGLALARDLQAENLSLEAEILAEEDCYPGLVFRAAGANDFELAYAAPHLGGKRDAVQYDPVFLGSNTWQIFCGPAYQATAALSKQKWFAFRVDVSGSGLSVQVGDQRPVRLGPLAHEKRSGRVGLWSYKPAFFRNLRMGDPRPLSPTGPKPKLPAGLIREWGMKGYGALFCEPNGVLNLNRYLLPAKVPARLVRRFEAERPTEITLRFGFSDELTLALDQEILFTGTNRFQGLANEAERGWIQPGAQQVRRKISPGRHEITAALQVTEPFGWGMTMELQGKFIRLLPATSH